jgi:hypothetical protein
MFECLGDSPRVKGLNNKMPSKINNSNFLSFVKKQLTQSPTVTAESSFSFGFWKKGFFRKWPFSG